MLSQALTNRNRAAPARAFAQLSTAFQSANGRNVMKNYAIFYRQIMTVIGIALLMAGVTRTSQAEDERDYADQSKFTRIAFPGADGTSVFGINPQGDIVGTYYNSTGVHGFVLGKGKYTSIEVPGAKPGTTQPSGINPRGDIVGTYADNSGNAHGFLLHYATFSTIDPPGTTSTFANGINPRGDIVGSYADSNGEHGFLLSQGTYSTIDAPRAVAAAGGTGAQGINPKGDIVGSFSDVNFNTHGFLLKNGIFTNLDAPGTSYTFANGINPKDDIVGYYNGSDGHVHGFLLSEGTFSTIDPPGSTFTQAWGISPQGDIVGYYLRRQHYYGFLRSK
jgi:probable HAF family extracellular repeat protein